MRILFTIMLPFISHISFQKLISLETTFLLAAVRLQVAARIRSQFHMIVSAKELQAGVVVGDDVDVTSHNAVCCRPTYARNVDGHIFNFKAIEVVPVCICEHDILLLLLFADTSIENSIPVSMPAMKMLALQQRKLCAIYVKKDQHVPVLCAMYCHVWSCKAIG